MRLEAALRGDLRKTLQAEADAIRRAEVAAVRKAGADAKNALRKHYADHGMRNVGYRWKTKFYDQKKDRPPLAIVYVKGGPSKEIVYAFEHGMTISAKNGRYLWIPTQFNRVKGRRVRNAKAGDAIIKPSEIIDGFVRKGKKPGTLVVYSPVKNIQKEHKKIKWATIDHAYVKNNLIDQAYVNNHLLGSGRPDRTKKILKYGAVPLFTLVKQTKISKKTDLAGMAEIVARDFQRDLLAALTRELDG
jgi:hypothetical protein